MTDIYYLTGIILNTWTYIFSLNSPTNLQGRQISTLQTRKVKIQHKLARVTQISGRADASNTEQHGLWSKTLDSSSSAQDTISCIQNFLIEKAISSSPIL